MHDHPSSTYCHPASRHVKQKNACDLRKHRAIGRSGYSYVHQSSLHKLEYIKL